MTEESTNSDWILVGKEKNDFKKLETNFENLQKEFVEEKESLKRKNDFLENELKEMDKKIQKIDSEHKNEIEEMKQKFQQLIDKNDVCGCFKQKVGNINSFEEEIFEEEMNFVKIGNKWKEIQSRCCYRNCINTNYPTDKCIKGFGFVNIIDDKNIKYLVGKGLNNFVRVFAENSFEAPQNCLNHSLYYFEIKCIFERKKSEVDMIIGFKNITKYDYPEFKTQPSKIWNDNDILGCGIVYPPANITNELPYIFLTQNGKLIEKITLEKDNFDSYKPYVRLLCCSVETNFGNDLKSKPFIYDISKH